MRDSTARFADGRPSSRDVRRGRRHGPEARSTPDAPERRSRREPQRSAGRPWPLRAACCAPTCPAVILRARHGHPWLRERLSEILTQVPASASARDPAVPRAAWKVWQAGLTMPFTLPDDLPPLRLLLVWDNLTGHKTPDLVLWLCAHGVMPLYTPVGGSWLNMAESI